MYRKILFFTLYVIVCLFLAFSIGMSLKRTNKPAVTVQFPNRIQETLPSVVHIMCDRWQASGVAIAEDIVVTARHVVDGLDYTITLNDGNDVRGIQAISHKDYDLGFIRVNKPILKPARLGSIKECRLGQQVFIIGSPYGKIFFNNVTTGIISNLCLKVEEYDAPEQMGWKILWQTDTATYSGNSGSPVFTMDGIVRGILVGGYLDFECLSFCVPVDLVMNDIENIKLMFAFNKYRVEE